MFTRRKGIEESGYVLQSAVLSSENRARLLSDLEISLPEAAASRRGDSVYAVRNLLAVSPYVQEIARSAAVRRLVEPLLGEGCFAVRAILFDKVPGANWNLTWHQDLSIAVRERIEIGADWGPWSVKAGIPHVQPPPAVLERMIAVRLHLDDCGPENGPLRVLPGTHLMGRLDADRIAELRQSIPEAVCLAAAGDALVMRPLLLHASSASIAPAHRRVLHIEFAADPLPHGLRWHTAISLFGDRYPMERPNK